MGQNYKYMVATRCFTYNHAPYIEDALRGFAMQETSFPVVYCIVDDASTDGEQNILKKWANENLKIKKGPSQWEEFSYGYLCEAWHKDNPLFLFVILLLKENYYKPDKKAKKIEFISPWLNESKYFAICEGDDYWNNKLKLKNQVEFLEMNDTVGLCYTKCRYYYHSLSKFAPKTWGGRSECFEEMIQENTVPTPSVMYRRELRAQYEEEINPLSRGWMLGDYPFWIWMSKEHGVKFLDIETCVYRVLEHSASHRDNKQRRESFIASVSDIQHFFADRYNQSGLVPKDKKERALLMDSFSNRDYTSVIEYYHLISNPGLKATIKYLYAILVTRDNNK